MYVFVCVCVCAGSVKKMFQRAASEEFTQPDRNESAAGRVVPPKVFTHSIRFPLAGAQDLLDQTREGLWQARALAEARSGRLRLCVFDAVTSNTAIALSECELRALVRLARSEGRADYVLVDAAHSLQTLDVDVPALGADWWVSNCHKHLCAPKGVAVLHVAKAVRAQTKPLVTSHGFGTGELASDFIWDGARDYSGMASLPVLLDWWQWVGHGRARDYTEQLLRDAVQLLTARWSTDTHAPMALYRNMACVRLPDAHVPAGANGGGATSGHAKSVQDALHFHHRIECPVKCLGGSLYVRISAAPYNTLAEYELLAHAMEEMHWNDDGTLKQTA
jgi:selenocysteine lyase/cysteine desulfurase